MDSELGNRYHTPTANLGRIRRTARHDQMTDAILPEVCSPANPTTQQRPVMCLTRGRCDGVLAMLGNQQPDLIPSNAK